MNGEAVKEVERITIEAVKPREINGRMYAPATLREVVAKTRYPETLMVASLDSLATYVENKADEAEGSLFVQVVNHETVKVYTRAQGEDNQRGLVMVAEAVVPYITLNEFLDQERFIIMLRSQFKETPDQIRLLKYVSRISTDDGSEVTDDGIAQSATVKKKIGGHLEGSEEAPGRVSLVPFRTFPEVEQPASEFVFRIRDGAKCALYEADGGRWSAVARVTIAAWLKGNISRKDVLILS